jgi:hypothetical protein
MLIDIGAVVMDLKKERMDAVRDAKKGVVSQEESLIPEDNIIQLQVMENLQLNCRLNHAACQLKLGEYRNVVQTTSIILETEPKCVKALFRRGQALLAIGRDLELVKKDFDILAGLLEKGSPEWTQLQSQTRMLDEKVKAHRLKERQIYEGKLFQ